MNHCMFHVLTCVFLMSTLGQAYILKTKNHEAPVNDNEVQLNERLGSVDRNQLMPNLYFFGVSKCGTSTMAKMLTDHPLVTAVGTENNVAGESAMMSKFPANKLDQINQVQTNRVAKHLQSKNDTIITNILR